MRRTRQPFARLRWSLALLAWLAQLCLPLAHAALMAAPPVQMSAWCGDPARALAIVAELPAELRDAFHPGVASAQHLDACAKLCAVGATPVLAPTLAPTLALRVAGLEPAPVRRPLPASREPAPKPPSRGPPARG